MVGAIQKKESIKAIPMLFTLRKIQMKRFCRFKPFKKLWFSDFSATLLSCKSDAAILSDQNPSFWSNEAIVLLENLSFLSDEAILSPYNT